MKPRLEISPGVARLIVWVLILCYIAFFSWLSVSRHRAHHSDAYDLGNVNQALWNTVRGRPLYFTNWEGFDLTLASDSRLAMHVEPIYFLIAPLYALWQKPETLLILQTMILALGAWPLFWLARDHLNSQVAGIAFAVVYLLFPGLQAANLWGFHAVALAAPLLLFAFYYGQSGRWGLLWLFAILAMATKEEIPLIVFMMALFFAIWGPSSGGDEVLVGEQTAFRTRLRRLLRRPHTLQALALALVAMIWFVLAVTVIIPHYEGQASPYLVYFDHLQDGADGGSAGLLQVPQALAQSVITRRNIDYLVDLFTPVAFLSLLSPPTLAFALPDLAIHLLSDHEPMNFVQKYHYTAPLLPGVMISAVLGTAWLARRLGNLSGWQPRRITLVLLLVVLGATGYYHYYHGFTPLARAFEPYRVTDHHRLGAEIASQIPADAAVSAQRYLNPHVSGRKTLYRFPYIGDAEYVFLDLSTLNNEGGDLFGVARNLINGGEFGLVRAEDGYLLLKRGESSDLTVTDEIFSFARIDPAGSEDPAPEPQYRTDVTYGDALKLIGFDLFSGRRTEMPQTPLRFNLYWQVLKPLETDLHVGLYLVDIEGEAFGGPDFEWEPGLEYWYPTSRWPISETIKLSMRNMPWWTAQFDEYSVAVGVLSEPEAWDMDVRLAPRLGPDAPMQGRLAGERTLVELMSFHTDPGGMPVPRAPFQAIGLPSALRPVEATWQNGIVLEGYVLVPQDVRPGEDVQVNLYWRTGQPLDADYTVFVHLVDGEGNLLAQHDAQPDGNSYPTTQWQVGQIVPDRHTVHYPATASGDRFSLFVGLYLPSTGERALLTDGTDAVQLP